MDTKKENKTVNILPWIKDDSYKSEEWQKKIEVKIVEIRGNSTIGRVNI